MTTPLPLKPERIYLTDGGLETTLIFHDGIDLPYFAAFDLLKDEDGRDTLRRYYRRYADLAVASSCGFIFETPTWRASRDWGEQLGYAADQIARVNLDSVALMKSIRDEYENHDSPMIISGNIGPRGDGYIAGELMAVDAARDYHHHQVDAFAAAGVDVVTAITMTNVEEATGIVLAAQHAGLACVIGFTTETDGRLPTRRVRGIRANASRCSHAELDEAEQLDDGDPLEFGELCREFRDRLPALSVFGGCCGTDHRHVDAARLAIC